MLYGDIMKVGRYSYVSIFDRLSIEFLGTNITASIYSNNTDGCDYDYSRDDSGLFNCSNVNGIHPNKYVYGFVSFIVNVIRSFPFLILMIFLLPFTKFVAGTSIGVKAAVVPLIVSASAFIGKLIENAMQEVDGGLIEAMKSFGITETQVVFRVMLSEALPAIISGIILATISILGATAMAGVMGAGGIGSVAVTYGYQKFNNVVMTLTAGILVVFVQLIDSVGRWVYRKMK